MKISLSLSIPVSPSPSLPPSLSLSLSLPPLSLSLSLSLPPSPSPSFPLLSLSPSPSLPKSATHVKSGHRLYWAKGTGFGTGSTHSAWNVDTMRAKKKAREKYVCLCFAILSEYLSASSKEQQQQQHVPAASSNAGPSLFDVLSGSCLLPALASYLVNDSSE